MTLSKREIWHGHLRLTLLQLLAKLPGFRANSSILSDAADASAGFVVTHDQTRTELAWLAEQGLVTLDELVPGLSIATLSERGGEVAAGRAAVPGVRRPSPGSG